MTPEEANETYQVLANQATDYANALTERAGLAQASYGPLAQQAMGTSQTGGIGNYTYNRLVRPTVDTLRDQLIVQGRTEMLNKQISDAVNAAKENYDNAYKRYKKANSGGGTTTTTTPETPTDTGWNGDYDQEEPVKTPLAGTLILGDTYTIIDKDGNRMGYRRPPTFNDQQWFNWVEQHRKQAEAAGNKFIIGD